MKGLTCLASMALSLWMDIRGKAANMGDYVTDEADQREAGEGLLAGRSVVDGRLVYPMPSGADAAGYQPVMLARRGRLFSWAVQRRRAKGIEAEESVAAEIAVGYVELDGQLMVEGHLLVDNVALLHKGMLLELTIETDDGGKESPIFSYAFRPVSA